MLKYEIAYRVRRPDPLNPWRQIAIETFVTEADGPMAATDILLSTIPYPAKTHMHIFWVKEISED